MQQRSEASGTSTIKETKLRYPSAYGRHSNLVSRSQTVQSKRFDKLPIDPVPQWA